MDKSNRKFKILYKCIKANFQKMEVQEKKSQENGPKVEKDKTERATGLGRRYRKVGSNWQ